jgi:hypothetical protein
MLLAALFPPKKPTPTEHKLNLRGPKIVPSVLKARLENKPACLRSIKSAYIPVLKHLQYIHKTDHSSLLMIIFHGVQIAEIFINSQAIVIIVSKELEGHLSILQNLYSSSSATPKVLVVPACIILLRFEG